MHRKAAWICLLLVAVATSVAAQKARTPNPADIYCSGMYTDERVPRDTYVISGEEARVKVAWTEGEYVYLNKGASQGVKVGDEYLVTRPVKDSIKVNWFSGRWNLLRAMGRLFVDVGRIRVVVLHPNVSIAQVVASCSGMQRGDYARPFVERPVPAYKPAAKFNRFAPVSGKPVAMVVSAKDFRQEAGTYDVVYVNLGSNQGVKIGDYLRFFRYQGTRHDFAYLPWGYQYKLYGYGSTPRSYQRDDLPREILGEGIVLRLSRNAATVLITYSLREISLGDYVEIQ